MSNRTKRIRNTVVKDLTPLENTLKRKLLAFYNQKIKPRAQDTPIEILRQEYNQYIQKLIRDTVQKSYFKAKDLVNKTIDISEFDFSITVTDAQNIEILTAGLASSFWATAFRLHRRETDMILTKDKELIQKDPFDKNAAMVAAAASVVYTAFNESIASNSQKVQFVTANDSHVDPELCRPLANQIFDANAVPSDATPPLHRHCRCTLIPI